LIPRNGGTVRRFLLNVEEARGVMAYITKANIEGLLGTFTIPAHWTASSDAQLTAAIARATAIIDSFTRNRFELTARTLLLSGDGTEYLSALSLTTWPLSSITSIYYRAYHDYDFDTQGSLVAAADYVIHPSRRAIHRIFGSDSARGEDKYLWDIGVENYRVRAVFGYTATPPAVKKAAVLLVQEEITAGTIAKFSEFESESYSDGYSYTRGRGSRSTPVASPGETTGFDAVDQLLRPFVFKMPSMIWL